MDYNQPLAWALAFAVGGAAAIEHVYTAPQEPHVCNLAQDFCAPPNPPWPQQPWIPLVAVPGGATVQSYPAKTVLRTPMGQTVTLVPSPSPDEVQLAGTASTVETPMPWLASASVAPGPDWVVVTTAFPVGSAAVPWLAAREDGDTVQNGPCIQIA